MLTNIVTPLKLMKQLKLHPTESIKLMFVLQMYASVTAQYDGTNSVTDNRFHVWYSLLLLHRINFKFLCDSCRVEPSYLEMTTVVWGKKSCAYNEVFGM
jgi:hypothetical protein